MIFAGKMSQTNRPALCMGQGGRPTLWRSVNDTDSINARYLWESERERARFSYGGIEIKWTVVAKRWG